MKLTSFVVAALFCCTQAFSQKDLPAFGKIDKADLLMTECSIDREAEAYKLIDWESLHYDRGRDFFSTVTERRVRTKILKEKGLSRANVRIFYYSQGGNEILDNLEGIVYNLDASGNIITSKINKTSIYKKKLDKRHTEVTFAFPEVKVGSVIEYKFTLTRETFGYIEDWYFQDKIPTRCSAFNLKIPEVFRFSITPLVAMKMETSDKTTEENIALNTYTYHIIFSEKNYTLRNVPAITDEIYMSSTKDYLQRLTFKLWKIDFGNGNPIDVSLTFPKMAGQLEKDEDFGKEIKKNVVNDIDLDKKIASQPNAFQQMSTIYNYVRDNMNGTGNQGIYSSDGVKEAWSKKIGSSAEINFILISLLRKYGLEVYPLLVSTRDNGQVGTTFADPNQFNTVFAYTKAGGNYYILNAADKYNPASLVPDDISYSDGLLLNGDSSRWIQITENIPVSKTQVFTISDISTDGIMTGDATIKYYNYTKNLRSKKWKESREDFKRIYLEGPYPSIKFDSLEVNNATTDSLPLEEKFKFTSKLNSSGNYEYFTLNLFAGLETNPFIQDQRKTDIVFGYLQNYSIDGIYYLPDGYAPEDLPKRITLITPDTSVFFKRAMQVANNVLNVHFQLEFRKPFYSIADYDEFKDFYKKLFALLNEQVVLKKM